MAKIISRKKQNDVYQRLVRIISELAKMEDSDDVRYAIGDAFDIALIVGDMEMLEALGENPNSDFVQGMPKRIGTKLANTIELIDDCMWK